MRQGSLGLVIAGVLATAAVTGTSVCYAQTQGMDRRDDRRDDRQDAREGKQECRAGDEKNRPECRQDKRDEKQDNRGNDDDKPSEQDKP